jgi:hypothetical protein
MISSDLHGAEEPIMWLLGWQRQDKDVTSPCTEKKKDAFIRTFWQRPSLWGSAPYRWDVDLDDQDATRVAWTISGACVACWASLARVVGCRSPRRGNVLLNG